MNPRRRAMQELSEAYNETNAMVRMVVGRRHVGESLCSVQRYVLGRLLKRPVKRIRATPKGSNERNALARMLWDARTVHRYNRAEYEWVMGGLG